MKIAILGAGSIGTLFGAHLAKSGHDVVLIGRKRHVDKIKSQNGVLLIKNKKKELICLKSSEKLHKEKYDFLFITTKAFSLDSIVNDIKILSEEIPILLIQNGLGNESLLIKNSIDPNRIIRGLTSEGAIMVKPGAVLHTGSGGTIIGIYSETNNRDLPVKRLSDILNNSGLPTKISSNIRKAIWEKCVINAVINPLGAILKKKNGEIQGIPGFEKILQGIICEAVEVARAENIPLSKDALKEKVLYVMEKTRENKNSMYIDIEVGRKTEIDFINGGIADLGAAHGIPTPYNFLLRCLIKSLEADISVQ